MFKRNIMTAILAMVLVVSTSGFAMAKVNCPQGYYCTQVTKTSYAPQGNYTTYSTHAQSPRMHKVENILKDSALGATAGLVLGGRHPGSSILKGSAIGAVAGMFLH